MRALYKCNRENCHGQIRQFLAEDEPGKHVYRYRCGNCLAEFDNYWEESSWGERESPPILYDFEPWEGQPKTNEITAWISRCHKTPGEDED